MILTVKKLLKSVIKTNCKKQIKKSLELKKLIKNVSEYFLEPKSLGEYVKFELVLSDYATKADLKSSTSVDTLYFAKKTDLANLNIDADKLDIDKLKNVPSGLRSLKIKIDKLDIGKLETTPAELIKLSNVVKNDVFKKTEHDELVKKVNAIQTTNTSNLVKKIDYNTKINETENKC